MSFVYAEWILNRKSYVANLILVSQFNFMKKQSRGIIHADIWYFMISTLLCYTYNLVEATRVLIIYQDFPGFVAVVSLRLSRIQNGYTMT